MADWSEVRLGDVAADVTVGFVGSMAAEYTDRGIPFLRSQNIRPYRIDLTDTKFIGEDFHRRLAKSALRPGDVVTVRTGKPGTTAVVPAGGAEMNCADLVITRPGPALDGRWLCYYLNSVTEGFIASHLVGAVQQHFNVGVAKAMVLWMPPLAEQEGIAAVLGALDDKIAVNAALSTTAFELAQAIFARCVSGSDCRMVPVARIASTALGGTPDRGRDEFWGGSIPWINSGRANERHVWSPSEGITEAGFRNSATKLVRSGSTLVAITGTTMGKMARLEIDACINQSIVAVWADDPPMNAWLHLALRSRKDALLEGATGAAQQHVSKKNVDALLVPIAEEPALRPAAADMRALLDASARAERESRGLAGLRDTLLPHLMSGRLRVEDAEKQLTQR